MIKAVALISAPTIFYVLASLLVEAIAHAR